ncbi:MAG: hypothetical protein K2P57_05790 [Burkholderiales bacterium]|nr:hypothetical protein [Burkholderiales bacterium]
MDRQAWLDGVKQRFGFDTWPRRTGAMALSRTQGFVLNSGTWADTWVLEQRLPHGDSGYADYFHHTENSNQRIMVRISEYSSHEAALEAMLSILSQSMTVTLPRLDERGVMVGDVGFCGYGEDIHSLVFVRHNILIDIRSIGDQAVAVVDPAKQVDAQIQTAVSQEDLSKEKKQ